MDVQARVLAGPRGASSLGCWPCRLAPAQLAVWSAVAPGPQMGSCGMALMTLAPQPCAPGRESEAREQPAQQPWPPEGQIRMDWGFWTLSLVLGVAEFYALWEIDLESGYPLLHQLGQHFNKDLFPGAGGIGGG